MEVIILATKGCNHRAILAKQLDELDVPYSVRYFDDDPQLIEKYDLHLSPNIMIDGNLVFRAEMDKRLPLEKELMKFVGK